MEKIVYILGAGFSKSVGAPLQSEIIGEIFAITSDNLIDSDYNHLFFSYREEFKTFLSEVLFVPENEFINYSLEDIYSIIDRSILDNYALRSFDKIKLLDIRDKINALIIMLMDYKLLDISEYDHIKRFSKHLVEKRKIQFGLDNESDPFTIISTNWDIVIDNSLQTELIRPNLKGILDYCFYIHAYSDYEFSQKLRSGLYWRGKDYFNIKILKLHGSMNWLQCQKCQRVFVTFFKKISIDQFLKRPTCNLCKKYLDDEKGAELQSVLVMPTFLKVLNNFQLKLSWQIAGIELQEATKIIFMGYSFPTADFELRQLLARSVKGNAKIDVVLHPTDEPISFPGEHPINKYLPEYRYKSFFGKREIKFFYSGVEDYIYKNY